MKKLFSIELTGKNINDMFALPCVDMVLKGKTGIPMLFLKHNMMLEGSSLLVYPGQMVCMYDNGLYGIEDPFYKAPEANEPSTHDEVPTLDDTQKEKMIADIMDDFDFEKVRDVMLQLNWTWATSTGDECVPAVWRIMELAKKLLEQVMEYYGDYEAHTISSGGLSAELTQDGILSLSFVCCETVTYPDDYSDND